MTFQESLYGLSGADQKARQKVRPPISLLPAGMIHFSPA